MKRIDNRINKFILLTNKLIKKNQTYKQQKIKKFNKNMMNRIMMKTNFKNKKLYLIKIKIEKINTFKTKITFKIMFILKN